MKAAGCARAQPPGSAGRARARAPRQARRTACRRPPPRTPPPPPPRRARCRPPRSPHSPPPHPAPPRAPPAARLSRCWAPRPPPPAPPPAHGSCARACSWALGGAPAGAGQSEHTRLGSTAPPALAPPPPPPAPARRGRCGTSAARRRSGRGCTHLPPRARPCTAYSTCPLSTGGKTRRVRLVRGEGRDVST